MWKDSELTGSKELHKGAQACFQAADRVSQIARMQIGIKGRYSFHTLRNLASQRGVDRFRGQPLHCSHSTIIACAPQRRPAREQAASKLGSAGAEQARAVNLLFSAACLAVSSSSAGFQADDWAKTRLGMDTKRQQRDQRSGRSTGLAEAASRESLGAMVSLPVEAVDAAYFLKNAPCNAVLMADARIETRSAQCYWSASLASSRRENARR